MQANLNNTKEKCRKFLSNLLELSSREPKPVEQNVQELIQELIDANVEPDQFCDRLERLLNASPQPCLIGFLKVKYKLHSNRQRLYVCMDFIDFYFIVEPIEKFTAPSSIALYERTDY